jgi:hypothetical protein
VGVEFPPLRGGRWAGLHAALHVRVYGMGGSMPGCTSGEGGIITGDNNEKIINHTSSNNVNR